MFPMPEKHSVGTGIRARVGHFYRRPTEKHKGKKDMSLVGRRRVDQDFTIPSPLVADHAPGKSGQKVAKR